MSPNFKAINQKWFFVVFYCGFLFFVIQAFADITNPEDFFGFIPGQDRQLFDYSSLINYLNKIDEQSDRLKIMEIGTSPLGRKMYLLFISSPANLENLQQLKEINKSLALDANIPDKKREQMIENGKVFSLLTLSMHSGEVGPSQALPLIAHECATTRDSSLLDWMNNVVLMIVPCHNPDGMDMVVEHYKKYKDSKYEGSSLPGVYHKYVGHDNNRDFVTLSQSDTRAIAKIYNTEWFPQVLLEKHQMGWNTARYFVPPAHDPIAENVDAAIWNWTWVFGSNMITDMTKDGCSGVSQHYLFDDYWPGSTETAIWKNIIALLTEGASVKYATPVFIEPNELRGFGKGLAEYKKSINMPLPWKGGWWRLSDIVSYEISSTKSLLKTSAKFRKEILTFRNDVCKREIKKGQTEQPFYFILPINQHDKSELVSSIELLMEHGITLYQLNEKIEIQDKIYNKGDIVIPLAQPYRAFIKEVLEKQRFPVRHYTPDGKIIKPYDITTWSIPLHRGLHVYEIDQKDDKLAKSIQEVNLTLFKKNVPEQYSAAIFDVKNNESYKIAFAAKSLGLKVERSAEQFSFNQQILEPGSFIINNGPELGSILKNVKVSPLFQTDPGDIKTIPFRTPKIGLVETYFHDMDAGWTRYIFDFYNIPYTVIHPGDFKETKLEKSFDVIVFPDADKDVLYEGKYKSEDFYVISSYPPDYTKGIEKEGLQNIMAFVDNGGTIVSWGQSTRLFMGTCEIKLDKDKTEEFQLPIQDDSKKMAQKGLYCPGSLVKIELEQNHILCQGMQKSIGVFYRGQPIYSTSVPYFDMDRRVIARFPEREILMSGYCEKEELLAQKPIMVWLKKGQGQLVLFGFNPQFRASTQSNYKLLFNALLLANNE